MATYYRWPSTTRDEFNRGMGGIEIGLRNYAKRLPDYGWQEVMDEKDADLVVGHLGVSTERLDVWHCHGLYPTGVMEMSDGFYKHNARLIANARRARYIVCVSDWVAEMFRRDMHLKPWVVSWGFDLEEWKNVPRGTFSDKTFVLWNKTRAHGVCNPDAVVELAQRRPKTLFTTTFVPKGYDPTPNIQVTGLLPRPEAWKIVKDSSIYLATTKETYGVGTLEAMASGSVVIGFRWGNTPNIVGDCGILVDPGDFDALAEALDEALDRHDELAEMAYKRVRTKFTWDATMKHLAACYDYALKTLEPKSPAVSVIIPCHNYADYVGFAIESIKAQTLKDYELIVVDDGSEDGSIGVIESAIANMPNARLIRQANEGVAHARNSGVRGAKGELICCLDADDALHPDFLLETVKALHTDNSLAIAYTGLTIIDSRGRVVIKNNPWPSQYDPHIGLAGNQVPTCCVYRKKFWRRTGGYRQRYAPHGAGQEDADFWFHILSLGGSARMVHPDGLFRYRKHDKQATHTNWKYWEDNRDRYHSWYPFKADDLHPFASQLGTPPRLSWPVRNYDNPGVSVITPVGPGHEYILADALDSVEAQTYRNWEMIVVNDSGTELDLAAWPFVRLFSTSGSRGAGYARNVGCGEARAPLVVHLDADDYLQPKFIERTLSAWYTTEQEFWVYTDLYTQNGDGEVKPYVCADWDASKLWYDGIAAITCLYPMIMWRAVGGFDEEIMRDDWDFHLRLAKAGFCGIRVPEPLFTYRHTTGTRRVDGTKRQDVALLRQRYSEEEIVMACRGCGGGRTQRIATPVSASASVGWMTKQRAGFEEMIYTGRSKNDLMIRAPSRRRYRAGDNRFHRRVWVHPDDVVYMERLNCFEKIGTQTVEA